MKLDTILENGRIYTIDPNYPVAQRIGILHGKVVGLDAELDGVDAHTRIDLQGAPVVPGFNDAHMHFSMMGIEMSRLDLSYENTASLEELYTKVEAYANQLPQDAWILGQGYDQNKIGGHPELHMLDKISGGRPTYLLHNSHHMAVANTHAFHRAGHTDLATLEPPSGGELGRYHDGSVNGLLQEQAMNLIGHLLKPVPQEDIIRGLATASRWALRNGITSATEPGVSGDLIGNGPADVRAFQTAIARDELQVRMTVMPYITALHSLGDISGTEGWGMDLGMVSGFGNDRLRIGPVKVASDGSLIGRTAAMCCDYHDVPGNSGFLQWEAHELREMLIDAHCNGWQIAAHAIGDRALDVVLDIFDDAHGLLPRHDPRHRIEHTAVASDQQIQRIISGRYIPVPQGRFISTLGDGFLSALGTERVELAYRMRSFVDSGVELPGSTDAPVVPGEALVSIHDMVNRTTDGGTIINAAEALTVGQALRAYTHGSAYAVHEEHLKGMLTVGKLADLVVLSDDLFQVRTDQIKHLEVRATMVDGTFAYDAEGVWATA